MPALDAEADVVFVVGTRFVQSVNPLWPGNGNRTFIQLDVDPDEVGRNVKPDVGIVADAKLGLAQLVERLGRHNRVRASRRDELAAYNQKAVAELDSIQPQSEFARAIRAELPDDGILVNESTQVGYWSSVGFPVYQPRTFITAGYQGTLGYGFPTSLGVQVGNPDKKVISVNGDGGFLFNVGELSSMARHRLNVATVVFDDGAYGNVRRMQRQQFNGHTIASDLLNPDFLKLAEAFGIRGVRAEGAADLRTALREALKVNEPALISVPVGEMPSMWHLMRGRQAATAPVAARG